MSFNKLASLPPEIGQLTSLKQLDLSFNKLASLPPEIGQLTSLKQLDMTSNQLAFLPPEIGHLTSLPQLCINNNQLTSLPPEIGQMAKLQLINLNHNQLTSLPLEIGHLTSLQQLNLIDNQLTSLPPEIVHLTSLQSLDLSGNQLTSLPSEIGHLTSLQRLDLNGNQLTSLPPEIGHLTSLQSLDLSGNQLTSLPSEFGHLTSLQRLNLMNNQLTSLPSEIGHLTSLQQLDLISNQLAFLPSEIGHLTSLQQLDLRSNQLAFLPSEIGHLTSLQQLDLRSNQLAFLPSEIGQLTSLPQLDLDNNQLTSLPSEIGHLTSLKQLVLSDNQLTSLPSEIGQLTNLRRLSLRSNQLTFLPLEIGLLTNLDNFYVDENPLVFPPPEVVHQGNKAVLRFLRELAQEGAEPLWNSKVVLVGEGGVGKTSLLCQLLGRKFNPQESTTRGVEIADLTLPHPDKPEVNMTLHVWDFGGQDIYHATHQFFLSQRSLFVLVWNGRLGWEQCRVYHWLEQIRALAPEAPVLLVATHGSDRTPSFPEQDVKEKYPQVRGMILLDNGNGMNVDQCRQEIQRIVADPEWMPLMGTPWPKRRHRASEALKKRRENHITAQELMGFLGTHGLGREEAHDLGQQLHDLGRILWFKDFSGLEDTVVLKPDWITGHVYRVLDSERVKATRGILEHKESLIVWRDLPENFQDRMLRMMEAFHISYRIPEDDHDRSVVVELLPEDPPRYSPDQRPDQRVDCVALWESFAGQPELKFSYLLPTRPAGIPAWFLAKAHRFSQGCHWRYGGLFGDPRRAPRHLARVSCDPLGRQLDLVVRGPFPVALLSLLKDSLEQTFQHYPGLMEQMKRRIPCPCGGESGRGCSHSYDMENLLFRRSKGRDDVECNETLSKQSVVSLLFGLHPITQDAVLARLEDKVDKLPTRDEVRDELQALGLMVQRQFLESASRQLAIAEITCPRIFTLKASNMGAWKEKLQLQLFCEHDQLWHPVGDPYDFKQPGPLLEDLGPYLDGFSRVLKAVGPAMAASAGIAAPDIKNHLDVVGRLAGGLGGPSDPKRPRFTAHGREGEPAIAQGITLRALIKLMEHIDPHRGYRGLIRTISPRDGQLRWLCKKHHDEETS
ncbi:MAG: leucine-rich repeat domain-containing protein [Magnetococcales bacterium]|nr:leucine-rich repeat domain-containing protein [Magnetococcales bacterium]